MSRVLVSAWKSSGLRAAGLLSALFLCISATAFSQCGAPANAIVAENCQPGNSPNEWDIPAGDAGDLTIQGFATDISVNQGGTVYFKINTPAKAYSITIYRMGYYGGLGARKIATITPSVSLPQTQPACNQDTTTGLTDCGNWGVSASWQVPASATSGIYFAHLVRSDTGGNSHIVFVVRNDTSRSAILFKTSDETWQAYNYYGNGSLYGPGVATFDLPYRAYKVSYNRPVLTRGFQEESNTWVFGAEFPMIQWLEQNGYDVTYSTGIDAARNPSSFMTHKMIMDTGHDEYISGPERATLQAARDAGVNLAFFSGNEMFWKTRWENSIDGTGTPYRTLVCYKETLAFAKLDPQDPPSWTGTWRDPTFSPPADGGKPENSLTGTLFMVNGTGPDNPGNLKIQVPAADGQMRFWRNTAAASLAPGSTYSLVTGSLGYEFDEDIDNGFRAPGAFRLSTSTYTLTSDLLLDYGGTYGAGPATHHMMMYRAASGALVFGAGTVNFSWGLNSNHDNPFAFNNPNPDPNMQQAVVNLFADMGIQPASLTSGLSPASASTDTIAPVSVITTPAGGASVNTGSTITVTGTATDVGGVVAGVEFSGDGGATWHPAIGRGTWSYAWTPTTVGTSTLLSRAVDDSGNIETPGDATAVSVSPQVCPCTIFQPSSTPANIDSGDSGAIEVGVKFRADADGTILGVRFYKAPTNTGTHVGHVWSSTGSLLGTATFTSESASGWQQVNFSTPIPATANTTYIVSYFAPQGHYSSDSFALETAGVDDPPLHALANGVDGQNGIYLYGPSGGFPTSSYNASNYWVDVVYTSSNTYSISGNISGYGGPGATVVLTGTESLMTTADPSGNYSFAGIVNGNYTVSASNPGVSFTPQSQPVTIDYGVATGVNFAAVVTNPLSISGTITGGAGATVTLSGAVAATATADSNGNFSFQGLLGGSYTITPSEAGLIFQPEGQTVSLANTSSTGVNFTSQACTCISIWPSTATPGLIDSADTNSVELGTKFTADVSAYITGIRFYKASTNTGTHIGHIWDASGNLLGAVTFTGETASGWQQAILTTPVWIQANTTYIVSYLAPNGHYSADLNYFLNSGVNTPPLHALQSGAAGPNGVYIYTTSAAFPINSYASTNYWVDVIYAAQQYSISGTINGAGGPGAKVAIGGTNATTITADASGQYSFTGFYGATYTITPSNPGYVFVPGTQTLTLGQGNATGIDFATPQICPCDTIWQPSATPALIDSGDSRSIELGVKVRADADGYVLGLRFYKAATNTGAHIGNLWADPSGSSGAGNEESSSGQTPGSLLATASFTNESPSGWQQVLFANPVPVTANTVYVASYFAPVGHYSADAGTFSTAGVDTPPLHALAQGVDGGDGVFTYSQTSALPTSSYQGDNYWVDVIYATTATHTLAGTVTGAGNAGATITLGGAGSATTVTDVNGNYSFNGLADGTYTVTPSEAGLLFSPAAQTVSISGGHKLGVNFQSGVPSYVVSGQVSGAPGISVVLSGATTTTVVADGNGYFTFPTVVNGTYTVTPSGPGYAVSPVSQTITVNGAAVSNLNFSAMIVTYSLSGTIAGGAGSMVSLSGPVTTTTIADANGNYSFNTLSSGSYTVTPSMAGLVFTPVSLGVAVNGANVSGVNFAVPSNCPCDTIWQATSAPMTPDYGDVHPVEVGIKFRADADAYIAGLRFYKAATNTGAHVGHLWTASGTLLGTATFSNESASGWQQVLFTSPIPVSANTTYAASYFAPAGHYAADTDYFSSAGIDSPPLHALQDGVDGPNGVFTYTPNGFPNTSFEDNASNYWVDVIYTPSATYSIAGTISGAGGPGASLTLSGSSTATVTADAGGNFSFNGLANGSYVVTASQSGYSYTPASLSATINNAHALGLSFSSTGLSYSISGTISGPGGAGAAVTLNGTSTGATVADSNGNYSFAALPNGAYTVAVSNTGFVFTPPSQAVTLNGANATAGFTSAPQTYTLAGTISGAGGPGAAITLSGASSASTVADASGNFTFANLANGPYTVAVNRTGYVFTPPSQQVTVNGANASATFSSAAQTYVLSGVIAGPGGAGATVSLTGASMMTGFADSSGAYSFAGVANGAYTVTVANTGYVFTPPSQALTINGANAAANFTSAVQTYTLSGTISGAGGPGATITLGGAATGMTTANAAGAFSFTVGSGTYTVAASRTGYAFTPASQAVTVNGANAAVSFSSAATHTVSGNISGPGGPGATITLAGAATVTTVANASGAYTLPAVVNGAYTLTPSNLGYVFNPVSRAITVNNGNQTQNFTSTQATYTISGTVSGTSVSGVTVRLTGVSTASTTTSASGAYSFTGRTNGSYTITPSKTGYVFSPASQAVTVNNASVAASFIESAATYSVSVTITGPGGPGASLTLSGAANQTATANSSGSYVFSGIANGNYTIAISRPGYTFNPASRSFSVSNANVTETFSSAAATYTISGTLSGPGASGATVKLSGAGNATTTSNGAGAFSFPGQQNGTYTVTPSKTGYVYTPASSTVTVQNANATANFNSSVQTYTLSGTISGAGGAGALVTLRGSANATTTANASGIYSFSGLSSGVYLVTPSKSGHTYSPSSQMEVLNNTNLTVNFTSR